MERSGKIFSTFHDHTFISVVVESEVFHDHTYESLVVESALFATKCESLVVESLRLDSYLQVMSSCFLLTTKVGFLVINHGREKHFF